MEARYPAAAEAYREKVQAFLGEHLPPGWKGVGALERQESARFAEEWRRTLHAQGRQ